MKCIYTLVILLSLSNSYGSGVHASEINETECSERMQTLLEEHPMLLSFMSKAWFVHRVELVFESG